MAHVENYDCILSKNTCSPLAGTVCRCTNHRWSAGPPVAPPTGQTPVGWPDTQHWPLMAELHKNSNATPVGPLVVAHCVRGYGAENEDAN